LNVLFNPRRFFSEIGKTIQLAPLLVAIRWIGTTSFITLPLWLFQMQPFSEPCLPIPAEGYYFWQLIFLLPYGIVLTLLLSGVSLSILRGAGRLGTRFRAVLAIISYGLFLPWIPCLAWDLFLIFSKHWSLVWAAPFHAAAVVAEGFLYAYGFRKVFGASWTRAGLIAAANCIIFIGLSAVIVR
jgi:hypothetical protein